MDGLCTPDGSRASDDSCGGGRRRGNGHVACTKSKLYYVSKRMNERVSGMPYQFSPSSGDAIQTAQKTSTAAISARILGADGLNDDADETPVLTVLLLIVTMT
jgi:hypothetical protein